MDPKTLIQTFVEAVNRQDWGAVESLVAAGFERHSIAAGEPGVHSRSDLIRFLKAEYAVFPDATEEIADIFTEDNKVAVRMRFGGTQAGMLDAFPATGKTVDSEYLAIYRIESGLIVEAWAE
jgi:steroid delta-isomerase-like uncharacterized protein